MATATAASVRFLIQESSSAVHGTSRGSQTNVCINIVVIVKPVMANSKPSGIIYLWYLRPSGRRTFADVDTGWWLADLAADSSRYLFYVSVVIASVGTVTRLCS